MVSVGACNVVRVPEEPLARLPDEIVLTRGEAAIVLFGLDVLDQGDVDPEDAVKVTRAVNLIELRALHQSLGPTSLFTISQVP